jgi:hypothetical protein
MSFWPQCALAGSLALVGCESRAPEQVNRTSELPSGLTAAGPSDAIQTRLSVWGVSAPARGKVGGVSLDRLNLEARAFALRMVGFAQGSEAVLSPSGVSFKSQFSTTGASVVEEVLSSAEDEIVSIVQMELPPAVDVSPELRLAEITVLVNIHRSRDDNGQFASRFEAELSSRVRAEMASRNLEVGVVYLRSMSYDEGKSISGAFILSKKR